MLDLSLFGDTPFLITAGVVALVETLKREKFDYFQPIARALDFYTYQLFRPPDGQAYRCSSFPDAKYQPNAIRALPAQGKRFPGTT